MDFFLNFVQVQVLCAESFGYCLFPLFMKVFNPFLSFLIFKQLVILPTSPLFFVMLRTLVVQIPERVQYMALSLGCGFFGLMWPIVLAWLIAIYSILGFCCSLNSLPGSTIKCLSWSFSSNPASKPWNLWIVVAQAVTRGQYVTEQHFCFCLHVLVIMGMGTCCSKNKWIIWVSQM